MLYFLTDFMLEVLRLKLYIFSFGIISALQDLKPRFHTSRIHGSDSVEDDVSYESLDMFIKFASLVYDLVKCKHI